MRRVRRYILPAYLTFCLILGGASAAGYVSNLILQLLGLGLIGWALMRPGFRELTGSEQFLSVLIVTGLVFSLGQLIPIPADVWASLPGRGEIAAGNSAAGISASWLAISLTPYETLASLLWLIPALAIAMVMVRIQSYRAWHLAATVLAISAISVLIGAFQLAQGGGSALYFYERTNAGSTVGFFANANHLATLYLVSIPFIAALMRQLGSRSRTGRGAIYVAGIGGWGLLFIGIVTNGSMAGLGLAFPVTLASLAILIRDQKRRRLALLVGTALVFIAPLAALATAQGQQMLAEGSNMTEGSRQVIHRDTAEAIVDFFPVGSGVGSFEEVYPSYSDPLETTRWYVNHAHSDYLELFMEMGLAGAILIALFLLWWARRSWRIFTSGSLDYFAGAAAIATGAVLAHSLVDYPLRTAAISAVFAMCCALLARPGRSRSEERDTPSKARHRVAT